MRPNTPHVAHHTLRLIADRQHAIQAAWAWQNRAKGYGAKSPVDPLEGWIADPSLLQS